MLSTVLDVLGAACLVAAVYLGFTALGRALALTGILFLLASRKANR